MSPLLLLVACTTPDITSVTPSEALPGATVRIMGSDLPERGTWSLVSNGRVVPIGELSAQGGAVVQAVLPEVEPGTWSLRVDGGGSTAELAGALTVPEVPVEVPCAEGWRMRSEASRTRKEVAIDRFGPDDARETTRIPFADVARVEYELAKLDDGDLCSSIYVRGTNGRRWPVDESRTINLAARAYRIGSVVGKPTEVTRADVAVDEDTRPTTSQ